MIKRILVPTDLSAVAENAVRFALNLFKNQASEFVFFNSGKITPGELQSKVETRDNAPLTTGTKSSYVTMDKNFSADLVKKLTSEYKIDLIVMGTHGANTPLTPDIFGSNAAAVLQESDVPVIAVPDGEYFNAVKKIVYASDLIKLRSELELVIQFATIANAEIDVVHITPVYPDLYDAEKINARNIIADLSEKHNFQKISYYIAETTFSNQIVTGINNYLEKHSADMLALFHAERSWIDRILDPSSTVKEVTHIKLPIIVFPKFKNTNE